MRPINPNGKQWGVEASGVAYDDIHKQAVRDLCARDERLSGGQMNAGNNYAPYNVVEKPGSDTARAPAGSRYVVNPLLVAMRHTGDEELQLTNARWAEFCSEPRDEKPYLDRILQQRRQDRLTVMVTAGANVSESLKAANEPMPQVAIESPPPKRGPGRPRKDGLIG